METEMSNWPQVSIDTERELTMCFACGRENPIGLKLNFEKDDKVVRAEFTPRELHQGWPGTVHGGIISCLLDEALNYAPYFEGMACVTAKMKMRLKRLALIDQPLIITASITKKTRKLVEAKADICLPDGTLVAQGEGTLFVINSG